MKSKLFCNECMFFEQFTEQRKKDNLIGICHANPPAMLPREVVAKFPVVFSTMWCGLGEQKEVQGVSNVLEEK